MNRTSILALAVSSVLTTSSPIIAADVTWRLGPRIDLANAPLDTSISADGRRLYILSSGEIAVYSFAEEKVIQRIPIGKDFDRMVSVRDKDILVLTSQGGKAAQIIELGLVHNFSFAGLPYKGPKKAPVTIAVFSDYQCPYCARLETILERLLEQYPNKVRLVFKNYPITAIHPVAYQAAIAALAADAQGKFWEFHNNLFANQKALSETKIEEIAKEVGLDMEKFRRQMHDPSIQGLIARDIEEGKKAGVEVVPTVFINGRLPKENSLQGITDEIEAELKKEVTPRR